MYDGWHDGGWGPGAWIIMGLMMLAFWGLVVGVVVYVVRNLGHRPVGSFEPPHGQDHTGIRTIYLRECPE